MNALGWAVVLLGFLVIGITEGDNIMKFLNQSGSDAAVSKQTADLLVKPKTGQQVCDFKMVIYPYFDAQGFDVTLSAHLGNDASLGGLFQASNPHPEAASYSWTGCYNYGTLDWLAFVPRLPDALPHNKLDFIILPAGQSVHFKLKFIAPDGKELTPSTNANLDQYVTFPAGAVGVPQSRTLTYLLHDLPKQTYNVEITSDIPINGQPAGTPYVYHVK